MKIKHKIAAGSIRAPTLTDLCWLPGMHASPGNIKLVS